MWWRNLVDLLGGDKRVAKNLVKQLHYCCILNMRCTTKCKKPFRVFQFSLIPSPSIKQSEYSYHLFEQQNTLVDAASPAYVGV